MLFIYVYLFVYTYIYTYVRSIRYHTCTYTFIHKKLTHYLIFAHTQPHEHSHTHIYIHNHNAQPHIHTNKHKQPQPRNHTHTHTQLVTCQTFEPARTLNHTNQRSEVCLCACECVCVCACECVCVCVCARAYVRALLQDVCLGHPMAAQIFYL
jgi:hypothetical protein